MERSVCVLGSRYTKFKMYIQFLWSEFSNIWPNTQVIDFAMENQYDNNAYDELNNKLKSAQIDADFIYSNEHFVDLYKIYNHSTNMRTYFYDIMKIAQINHNIVREWNSMDQLGYTRFDGTLYKLMNSEIISCPEYYWKILLRPLIEKNFGYSKEWMDSVEKQKLVFLPPVAHYKFPVSKYNPPKFDKEVNFLWNSRMDKIKEPKTVFGLILDFHKKYPDVPVKVTICSEKDENALKYIPEELLSICNFVGMERKSKEKYEKNIADTNISIAGSADAETWGAAYIDVLKKNKILINLNCNGCIRELDIDKKISFEENQVVDAIYKIWSDKNYMLEVYKAGKDLLERIPSKQEYVKILSKKMDDAFNIKTEKINITGERSRIIKQFLNNLEKENILTKQELFKNTGWDYKSSMYWVPYYYSLRKLGMEVIYINNIPHFVYGDYQSKIKEKKDSLDLLF